MHPILFTVGDFTIYGYGLMMALGMVAALIFACNEAKRHNIDPDMYFNGSFMGIIAGVIGSKILYWIVELDDIIKDPSLLLDLSGGFVIYGGVIAGVLVPVFYLVFIKKTTVFDKLDIAGPGLAIGQCFGRIGCFLAGCCYGKECAEGAWYSVTFPVGADAPAGVALINTQLISAAGDLILFLFLTFMLDREKFRGQVFCLYAILYSAGRFFVELLRDDERGNVGIFSTSQLIGIIVIILGIAGYIFLRKKNMPPLEKKSFVSGKENKDKEKQKP